ncbi:MAG: response regulator [Candidatus Celaenobacter antarcticus]|nr:response regulator [Candidatus Celaenobacter antarcticus]
MKKILLIDDVKDNLRAAKEALEDLIPDCQVITTLSGKEGVKLAKEEQPDTIISDIIMPEMDGIEVCKRLREDEATKYIPIIIHTGTITDTKTRIQCLEAGADVFLAKPIDPGELIAQINAMLRIKEAENKLRAESEMLDEVVKKRTKEIQKVNKKLRQDISERKKAEKSLAESEQLNRAVIEHSPIGISIRDKNGTFLLSNNAWQKLWGLSDNEVSEYHKPRNKLTFDDKDSYLGEHSDNINKVYKTGGEYHIQDIKLIRDEKDKAGFISQYFYAIKDEERNVQRVVILTEDITERKQAEEALKESERQILAIFNDPKTFIGILETDGTLKSANTSALTFIGKSISDVKGAKFWETPWWNHSPELQKKVISGIRKASAGERVHFEAEHIGKNNERIFVDFSIRPVRDSHGKIESLIVEGIDITERKRAEKIQKTLYNISNALNTVGNLHELFIKIREYLGNVIDTTNLYVALYDEKTDSISLPYNVDEKDDYETFPAGKTITKYVIETGKPLFATKDVVRKLIKKGLIETIGSPSEIWLGVPLKIESQIIGVIALQSYDDPNLYSEKDIEILTFISEEIALAIQHKQADEELKINRERLKTANSILRHDITNDIVVIKSALDIYRDENDETMLDEIEKRVEKSINTINKQREQEKFIDSHSDLDEFEIEKVVHDIIPNFPDIKINVTGKGTAYADNAIYSVFENIIDNAVKHGKTTKMDIDIRSDEEYCEIRFADYGTGIPDDLKYKIFDEGFSYGKAGHTGIGLYIVQKTIDDYDGFVHVEDNKPNGAVFVVRLRKIIER